MNEEKQFSVQEERAEYGKEKPRAKDTARLIWASKPKKEPTAKDLDFQTAEEVYPNKEDIGNLNKKLNTFWSNTKDISDVPNRIIWGDNLLVMKALLAKGYEGQIDLVYIDPPFNTGENFNFSNQVKIGNQTFDKELSMNERLAYTDTWKRGIDSFLDMLYPRLQLMRKLLSEKGAIYIHIDQTIGHYVKAIADEIFGMDNFRSEIIWKRATNKTTSFKTFGIEHDTILYYTKSIDYTWNQEFKDYDSDKKNRYYCYFEQEDGSYKKYSKGELNDLERRKKALPSGRRFALIPIINMNKNRPNLRYEFLGRTEVWAVRKERMLELYNQGLIVQEKDGAMPLKKQYLDQMPGIKVNTIWDDIYPVNSQAKQRTDYPTQKPEELLQRIIKTSTNEGDLVADFFCGSGTTSSVAERTGRRWITSDLSKTSIQVTRSRLVNNEALPFLIQNLGNYQRQLIYANEINLKEMYTIILKLYGANPRDDRQAFGISKQNKNTLVYVSEPDRPMMADKAMELAKEAKNMDGKGYKKLVILAWDYEMGFDQDWNKLATKKTYLADVETKIIPSDVYKYLRSTKVGDPEISEKIVFYQKPYLRLDKPSKVQDLGKDFRVGIKLSRYVVPDIPVRDEKKRPEVDKLLRKNFAYLIDYWTIDWDYDGQVFRSNWQAIKERKKTEPVPTSAETTLKKGKKYKIAVRVVDVFGNDAFGIQEVDLR